MIPRGAVQRTALLLPVALAIFALGLLAGQAVASFTASESASGLVSAQFAPDMDSDSLPDALDNCPGASNFYQQDGDTDAVGDACDNCPSIANAGQENTDGDKWGDACEIAGCETIATAWNNPTGDSDCDGYPDTATVGPRGRENFIGTDPTDRCPDNSSDDAWPPDVNNSGTTNLSDVVLFGPHFNKVSPNLDYSARFDLNASNSVNLSDIVALGPFFNRSCT